MIAGFPLSTLLIFIICSAKVEKVVGFVAGFLNLQQTIVLPMQVTALTKVANIHRTVAPPYTLNFHCFHHTLEPMRNC